MSNVEEFPIAARRLSEYDALVAAAPSALDVIPGGRFSDKQMRAIVQETERPGASVAQVCRRHGF